MTVTNVVSSYSYDMNSCINNKRLDINQTHSAL